MELFEGLYQFSELFESFSTFIFEDLVYFFDFNSDGILNYWPFFLITTFTILFIVLKGIVNLINGLQ